MEHVLCLAWFIAKMSIGFSTSNRRSCAFFQKKRQT